MLLLSACSGDQPIEPVASGQYRVTASAIAMPERKVWHITVADLDGDGDEDLLPAGHGGEALDRPYFYDGLEYRRAGHTLPRSPDRHGCAAGDVNLDGIVDLYCAAGAERGEGAHANELWLGLDAGGYRAVPGAAGAAYASSRGRYVSFLDANGDSWPDLFVSTWGERSDGDANDSALFLNEQGQFARRAYAGGRGFEGRWGGRCLAVGDISGDGLDDVAACAELEGSAVFVNTGNGFSRLEVPGQNRWWSAMALLAVHGPGPRELFALSTAGKGGRLSVYNVISTASESGQGAGVEVVRRLAISLEPMIAGCVPRSLAGADINGDGATDLFVTREAPGRPGRRCAAGTDGVLLGPDWVRFIAVADSPLASDTAVEGDSTARGNTPRPTPGTAIAANGGFIRSTAGPDWPGTVERLLIEEAAP